MYGAIIGDVAGSSYELCEAQFAKTKVETPDQAYDRRMLIMDYNTPLFNEQLPCTSYTDDTYTTLSILKSTIENKDYATSLREDCKYEYDLSMARDGYTKNGKNFDSWILTGQPTDSYGDGSAMRVSAIGNLYNDIETIKKRTIEATICSHNHPESILCALAVTTSIYYLKNGMNKEQLKKYISDNYFSVDYNLDNLRKHYYFVSRAIFAVPIAFYCFLVSNNFEDSIRTAISCGGDTDTIASITGALSEAYYGIPTELINQVKKYLREDQISLLDKVYENNKIKCQIHL